MNFFEQVWQWFTTASNWTGPNGAASALWQTFWMSLLGTGLAAAAALPPAILLGHKHKGGALAIAIVNIGRAIPSFAILALALPITIALGLGLGFWPTLAALFFFALPPLFTNTYTGIRDADPTVVEAARGMGMTEWQIVVRIELPIATPLIMEGLRTRSVAVVATSVLGAWVGWGGIGQMIRIGLSVNDNVQVFAGAFLVALLAVAFQAAFTIVERFVLPRGIRRMVRPDKQGVEASLA